MVEAIHVDWEPKAAIEGMMQLSPMAELAYRRILDMIYITGDKLIDDDKKLAWSTKAGRHWKAAKEELLGGDEPKIYIENGLIRNRKCTKKLHEIERFIAQKSEAGKASAKKRKSLKDKETASTGVAPPVETETPTEPPTAEQPTYQPTNKEEEKGTSYPKENKPDEDSTVRNDRTVTPPESDATLIAASLALRKIVDQIPTAPPEDLLDIPGFLRRTEGSSVAAAPEPSLEEMFDQFWAAYPKRVGRGQAEPKFKAALKKTTFPELMAGVRRYAKACETKEAQYIAHAATWLNGKRWLDEPDKEPPRGKQDVMGAFDKLREKVKA